MRWLTGWSGSAPGAGSPAHEALDAVRPIAARPLWAGPDPLWAVGDWRPEEIRLVTLRPGAPAAVTTGAAAPDPAPDTPATTRLAVLGHCGASDAELAAGLAAARGGAVRHLSAWPGSYTAVLRAGARSTLLLTDLAGALPVFHTPWCGGTAYATAALPLADLVGAPLDIGHLAARLACPESPEALGTGTPYLGVQRVPPGHVLAVRGGRPYTASYDEHGGPVPRGEAPAVRELTRALLEAVRSRVRTPAPAAGFAPEPGPAGGPEPTRRPRLGVDLSYGTASATVALLAAAVPLAPARDPATSGREGAASNRPAGRGAPAGSGPFPVHARWAATPARGPGRARPRAPGPGRRSRNGTSRSGPGRSCWRRSPSARRSAGRVSPIPSCRRPGA